MIGNVLLVVYDLVVLRWHVDVYEEVVNALYVLCETHVKIDDGFSIRTHGKFGYF